MENQYRVPAYRIQTTVSSEGIIHLPKELISLFNQRIELLVIEKKNSRKEFSFSNFQVQWKSKRF